MRIGIDISALQGPHRMRGIGYALLNFINNISPEDRKKHTFVFFVLPDEYAKFSNPLKLLDLDGLSYELRMIGLPDRLKPAKPAHRRSLLPGRLRNLPKKIIYFLAHLKDHRLGDPRKQNFSGIDVYLQPDQSQPLPRKFGLKKALIIYDIIPYMLDGDYLISYATARERGYSYKGSVRLGVSRWLYAYKLKINARRADLLLSISFQTKHDFTGVLGVKDSKITVTPLGVSEPKAVTASDSPTYRYVKSSWGYIKRPYDFPADTPFLLFVGGADRRRKLSDLVTAFNNLRAQGCHLKLVLAGDTMQGPENIPTEETQLALKHSSYLDDIIFLGFTDDAVRDWLYHHALAFVYPSIYEGFGLPVLESMVQGCPVICYRNEALKEIGAEAPLYAGSAEDIRQQVVELLSYNSKRREALRRRGLAQANKFSWTKTSSRIISALSVSE